MSARNRFTEATLARDFMLGGNARLTVVSERTGVRFTFKIAQKKGDETCPHFVGLLSGPDNDSDYRFLGSIFSDGSYRHGKKSGISTEAPSAKAFVWIWSYLSRGALPPTIELWHEGRCGRCNRALTVPESIASGIGPVCEGKA